MGVKNIQIIKIQLLLLAMLYFAMLTKGEIVRTTYTAELSGGKVTPALGSDAAFGVAICIYNRNAEPKELDCEVQFDTDAVTDPGPYTAAIYLAPVASVGPLIYSFTVDLSTKHFRQTFQLTTLSSTAFSTYTVKSQEIDFLNGNWYIQISSPSFPEGDLRGNLLHEHLIYSKLRGNNMVPNVETQARGLAIANYAFSPTRVATFSVSHSVSNPTQIQIRRGTAEENGPQDGAFSGSVKSPVIDTSVGYQINTQKALEDGDQYLQINSVSHPNGEIRGQLVPVDYLPRVSFTARMDSMQVIPYTVTTATGCALFAIDCNTRILTYYIYHTITTPVNATINMGNEFENGPAIISLVRAESPIIGTVKLSTNHIILFYQKQLYVTISSYFYPNGEIRGQITDKYNFYSYITGTQTIPPTTTSGLGCATFRMAETTSFGRVLDYHILFNSKSSVSMNVELLYGNPGSDGVSQKILTDRNSPAAGTDVYLTSTQESWFGTNTMYVQIANAPSIFIGAAGELRGQIYGIQNPCPILVNDSMASIHSSTSHEFIIPSSFEWIGSAPSLLPPFLSTLIVMFVIFFFI